MFERSLNRHRWGNYLRAVMELKHASEHSAKDRALPPALMFPSLPVRSWSQYIPMPTVEAFPPIVTNVGWAISHWQQNPDVNGYGWAAFNNDDFLQKYWTRSSFHTYHENGSIKLFKALPQICQVCRLCLNATSTHLCLSLASEEGRSQDVIHEGSGWGFYDIACFNMT